MANRKLPANYDEPIYVKGFLHHLVVKQPKLDYGYSSNHVPHTSGKSRAIKSSFDLAKQTRTAN